MATRNLDIVIGASDAYTSTLKRAERAFGVSGQTIGRIVKVGMAAATVSIVAMTVALHKSIQAANEQEAAETKLNAALQSTASIAGLTSTELKKMAAELQKVTLFGDEATIAAQALMLTFTNIRKDVFPEAIKIVQDISTAMGQDLKSSTILVGKALNDPILGLSALTRVGITFNDQQKEIIKTMVEMGDTAAAQRVILEELNTQFGGQAEAAARNWAGRITQSKNALGDLLEEIGFIITKNKLYNEVVRQATDLFSGWATKIQENRSFLMAMAKDGFGAVVAGIGTTLEVMRFFHNGWLGIKLVATAVIMSIIDIVALLNKTLSFTIGPIMDLAVQFKLIDSNPITDAVNEIQKLQVAVRESGGEQLDTIDRINDRYTAAGESVKNFQTLVAGFKVEEVTEEPTLPETPVGVEGAELTGDPMTDAIIIRMQFRDKEIEQMASLTDIMAFHAERGAAISGTMAASIAADNKKMAWSAAARSRLTGKANRAMEDQMLSLIETGKFSLGAFAKIMAQQVKIELVGIAARAAVQALYYAARGTAAAAMGDPRAGMWFSAAGQMAVIGGAALVAAGTVQALVGGGAERGAPGTITGSPLRTEEVGGFEEGAGLIGEAAIEQRQAQSVTIIVQALDPSSVNWDKLVEDNIVPAINRGGDRDVKLEAQVVQA